MPINSEFNDSELTEAQSPTFTAAQIEQILSWWQQTARERQPELAMQENLWQPYCRLMEIFCVVKSGGVATQMQAAAAMLQHERTPLEADLAAAILAQEQDRVRVLNQELQELQKSIHWRMTLLKAIHPQDEALVSRYLADIEQVLIPAIAKSDLLSQ
ncbi:MAG: hypothetical protein HC886_20020 [Leptolyngbyaceae cyanobacterium SM1_1_3]|nr:hypothetical protein [Leptolyngbyaceae cyanobacterium SM1_1_3]NJN04246.1 hypothetical protein [Leptolyngbyaceae cyanobacterium RM1_1_2]NJO10489.1 hypothetical protein [Leptolyngbyaceae cyanobacterium SL_1_1]